MNNNSKESTASDNQNMSQGSRCKGDAQTNSKNPQSDSFDSQNFASALNCNFSKENFKSLQGAVVCDENGKNWQFGQCIGRGSFGDIYLASDVIDEDQEVDTRKTKYIIKVESQAEQVRNEVEFLQYANSNLLSSYRIRIGPPSGIPLFYGTGSQQIGDINYRFLIEERFESDLCSLIKSCIVPSKNILEIAYYLMDVIENIHDNGYCHNDIKSTNIMISTCEYYKNTHKFLNLKYRQRIKEERLFIIDYGLCSSFVLNDNTHIPLVMDSMRAHDGTYDYSSRDSHCGLHSRRSDMESIGYNLIKWSQGYLPWHDEVYDESCIELHRAKEYLMANPREMLRKNYGTRFPTFIIDYLELVKKLSFWERPDYSGYKRLFAAAYSKRKYPLMNLLLSSSEIKKNAKAILRLPPKKNRMYSLGEKYQKSYTDIERKYLLPHPIEIARERVREEEEHMKTCGLHSSPIVRNYEGTPTYAILGVEHYLRKRNHSSDSDSDSLSEDESILRNPKKISALMFSDLNQSKKDRGHHTKGRQNVAKNIRNSIDLPTAAGKKKKNAAKKKK